MPEQLEVTAHALTRLRARWPHHAGRPAARLVALVEREVDAAIACGRMATRMPAFAAKEGRRSRGRRGDAELDRAIRFVWTQDEGRVYVIRRSRTTVYVITTVRPATSDTGPQ